MTEETPSETWLVIFGVFEKGRGERAEGLWRWTTASCTPATRTSHTPVNKPHRTGRNLCLVECHFPVILAFSFELGEVQKRFQLPLRRNSKASVMNNLVFVCVFFPISDAVIVNFPSFFRPILLFICRVYTTSQTHVGIKIVQTPAINLLTSKDSS